MAVGLLYSVLQEQLPDIHAGKGSNERYSHLRNPLREKERNQRVESASKNSPIHITENRLSNRSKQDQSSAKDRLAYILGKPGLARENSRHQVDRYISVEHGANADRSRDYPGKVNSYKQVNQEYPSYRKNDEISRIRVNNEMVRAQSSKRLPSNSPGKARHKEYSLQPKYNAHSRYLMQKDIDRQKAAIALDSYKKQYPGRPIQREQSLMEARIYGSASKSRGAKPAKYLAQRVQVIKRPEYYPKIKDAQYIYNQPDWWG